MIRLATYSDIPEMMNIVHQAQTSLKLLGVNQWQNDYPSQEIVSEDIANKCAYVLISNKQVIAIMTIICNYEPTYNTIYNGKWLSTNEFVVVHRMAVHNCYRKKGIASLLLKKVEEIAIEKNIASFKIDTHKDNIPMRQMLQKNNFVYCGYIILSDGEQRLAYEKLVDKVDK